MDPISVTIEGSAFQLEDREYTGSELRGIASLAEKDKLVIEEADGTETALPPTMAVRLAAGRNLYVSARHRRG